MRFRSIGALCALAVGAVAQTSIPVEVQKSVLHALATAIPRDQASYAVASPSAFAAEMASAVAAGNTPAWYQALPSDVKNLLPVLYPASAYATPTQVSTPTPSASTSSVVTTITSSVGTLSATSAKVNSTISGVHTPTLSASAARSSAAQATANAAPYNGAALGAGVGAALGFLGMLVL